MLMEQCNFQLMPLPHISLSETNVPVMNLPGVSTSRPTLFYSASSVGEVQKGSFNISTRSSPQYENFFFPSEVSDFIANK